MVLPQSQSDCNDEGDPGQALPGWAKSSVGDNHKMMTIVLSHSLGMIFMQPQCRRISKTTLAFSISKRRERKHLRTDFIWKKIPSVTLFTYTHLQAPDAHSWGKENRTFVAKAVPLSPAWYVKLGRGGHVYIRNISGGKEWGS